MLELFISTAIAVVIIISVSRVLGELMPKIRQPRVIGEMLAGVLLGPTLLGTIAPQISNLAFPKEILPILFVISNFGLSIYMFLIGMEIDVSNINSKSIKSSFVLSSAAILFPFISVIPIVYIFYNKLRGNDGITEVQLFIFLGTSLAITAFPMLARILEEKKITKTKLGEILLISASIQDVVSWILLSFIISLAKYEKLYYGFFTFIGCILFIICVKVIIKPMLIKISNKIKEEKDFNQNTFAIVIIILIICSILTDKIGLYSVFGGFVFGMAIPRNPILINAIKIRLYDMLIVFFLPIFFAYSGLNTNINRIVSPEYLLPCVAIIFCGIAFKTIPIFITMKLMNYPKNTSIAIAGLMNARGLMELIIANIGIMYGIINYETYSILVLLAIISTTMAMPIYEYSTKNGSKFG